MIPPPDSMTMDISPEHVLPLTGQTKFGKEGPNFPLPKGIVESMPTGSVLPPWGKGDPSASITGTLPHLLGKSKPKQRSSQIFDLEFQKSLQDARAVRPSNKTGEQYVIIACMTKHKKQQTHAKATPPFTIQQGIMKELADTMQAWIACPLAMRQLPDGTLNLHDVDFYIWMKTISRKEDAAVFKQAFWHLFTVPNWFNTLTNAQFHKDGSVNGCMCLGAPKKCTHSNMALSNPS